MRRSRSESAFTRWFVQERSKRDEELVLSAQAGDKVAQEELLNRYKDAVRARARKFFLAGGETEDLVQEGMIGLYCAVRDYQPSQGKTFKNFAYLCVTRRIYDALRIDGRHPVPDGGDPDCIAQEVSSPEDIYIDDETRLEFDARLLKVLSDFEYRVIRLYLDGTSYAVISESTGKDVKSIDNALARAKKKLQSSYLADKK